jgi:hypothetical protein
VKALRPNGSTIAELRMSDEVAAFCRRGPKLAIAQFTAAHPRENILVVGFGPCLAYMWDKSIPARARCDW